MKITKKQLQEMIQKEARKQLQEQTQPWSSGLEDKYPLSAEAEKQQLKIEKALAKALIEDVGQMTVEDSENSIALTLGEAFEYGYTMAKMEDDKDNL